MKRSEMLAMVFMTSNDMSHLGGELDDWVKQFEALEDNFADLLRINEKSNLNEE